MNKKNLLIHSLLGGFMLLNLPPLATGEEGRARMKDEQAASEETVTLVRESEEVYKSFVQGTDKKVPQEVLDKARCVAVFPGVVTAAAVIGATHGDGVASCRQAGKWTQPAFVDMTGGSLGAQIGSKSSDIVVFLMDEKAERELKDGEFDLGADVGVVAGTFDSSVATNTSGAIAYSRTAGAFAGASITGVNIAKDDKAAKEYYGKEIEYSALLDGKADVGSAGESFVKLLP